MTPSTPQNKCSQGSKPGIWAKLNSDLKSPWLIHLKGALFVLAGIAAAVAVFIQIPSLTTAVLLGVMVWAFCRFYYYLFYVLERYLGREKKFAGIFDAVKYLLFGSRNKK
jgi:hypothetical protein